MGNVALMVIDITTAVAICRHRCSELKLQVYVLMEHKM